MRELSIAAWMPPHEESMVLVGLDEMLGTAVAAEGVALRVSHFDKIDDSRIPAEAIRVVSLGCYLEEWAKPWPQVHQRFRDHVATLSETGAPLFLLTVFRCVYDRASETGQAMLAHIRRLNLAAIELSRELGAYVVDLDRTLADIGGLALDADCRLASVCARDVAGRELALCLATNSLDDYLSIEAIERVRASIGLRPTIIPAVELVPTNLVALGKGRRRQRVSVNTDAVQESHVSWLIGQAVRGRIGFGEMVTRLTMAVRRRGLRESLGLLVDALWPGSSRASGAR